MENIKESFVRAFQREIDTNGYGAQKKVASELTISRQHINDVLGGRKVAGKRLQERIANFYGYSYENFLALGRMLLDGVPEEEVERKASVLRKRQDTHRVEKSINVGGGNHTVQEGDQELFLTSDERRLLETYRKLIPWNLDGLPFPSSRSGNMQDTNVLGKALRRLFKLYNQKQAAAGLPTVEPFTPHDLRHTAATHMAHMGISEFDIGKVLNHTNQSITGVYNHYAYDKEKRRALVMWARRLTQIIRV